jgi:hypothetical protein
MCFEKKEAALLGWMAHRKVVMTTEVDAAGGDGEIWSCDFEIGELEVEGEKCVVRKEKKSSRAANLMREIRHRALFLNSWSGLESMTRHCESVAEMSRPEPVVEPPDIYVPDPASSLWDDHPEITTSKGMQETTEAEPTSLQSYTFSTDSKHERHLKVIGINGVLVPPEQAKNHAEYVAQLTQGQGVDWVYNKTHGLLDLAEAVVNLGGVSPNTVEECQKAWTEFHHDNNENSRAKCIQPCHSQGAIHVYNALSGVPQEVRDRVIVVAFAPAKVIPKELCYDSFNYKIEGDVIPELEVPLRGFFEVGEIEVSPKITQILKDREELKVLPPVPGYEGSVHDFQHPRFKEALEKHLEEYFDRGGEYP